MKIYTFLVLFVLLFTASFACAQGQAADNGDGYGGLIEKYDGTLINWGSGFLSASSSIKLLPGSIDPVRSKALAVRQGGVESRKGLLDMVLSLPLDSRRKVSSIIKDDLKSLNSLRGYVQNSLLDTAVDANGIVVVTSSLNLRNGLSSIIIPPTISFQTGIPPTISGDRGETGAELQALESEENGYIDSSVYSGILVDARGLDCNPVLLPLIYDGRGVGVYGPFAVSRETVLKRGIVTYMTDDKSENLRSRIGNFPLKVKAVNTHGASRSNLILSLDDAVKVRAVLKRKIVSENCSVVILVDKPSGAVKKDESVDSADEELPQDASAVTDDSEIQEESLDAHPAEQNQQR
ncbi:hypothetical protein [Maridesulfovibrio sp.]|uniref:hypothetical protein n=1 Tax=Maridesulfovibrio sp. TaxID=2795000 RepID=UPI002A18BEAF|nr:hypothetical protein [Maridesulfovibrio sp.]